MKTLIQLKPEVGEYVRCLVNPLKESLTTGRFYKVLPGNRLRDDRGSIVYTMAKFEKLPKNYLEAFK